LLNEVARYRDVVERSSKPARNGGIACAHSRFSACSSAWRASPPGGRSGARRR
jgi:hypothetical protein